jgi:hypothetical protein
MHKFAYLLVAAKAGPCVCRQHTDETVLAAATFGCRDLSAATFTTEPRFNFPKETIAREGQRKKKGRVW